MNKVSSLDECIDKVQDGMTIMIGGFLGVGAPLRCIERIAQKRVKNLTVMSVVSCYPGGGFDLAPLFVNRQVRKFITAHAGTCPEGLEAYKVGDMEIEYHPMGNWTEKIRAGGAGLGGVLTPIGIGTLVEKGKQKLTINGKEYLLELPLRADMAFIKAYRADKLGNVEYRGVSQNSNPVIAMAANFTVAEVNEIVEIGAIKPEQVGTPSVFVKAVVQGNTFEQHQETFKQLWIKSKSLK